MENLESSLDNYINAERVRYAEKRSQQLNKAIDVIYRKCLKALPKAIKKTVRKRNSAKLIGPSVFSFLFGLPMLFTFGKSFWINYHFWHDNWGFDLNSALYSAKLKLEENFRNSQAYFEVFNNSITVFVR